MKSADRGSEHTLWPGAGPGCLTLMDSFVPSVILQFFIVGLLCDRLGSRPY